MTRKSEKATSLLDEVTAEFEQEQRDKAKRMLKDVLRRKASAELVLKNIERELDDLQQRIAQGDIE
ncbi:MAG: hypothetical protein JO007_22505 [Alphaproteobacteria bacterium]|nr:hypothetical protein [Alphaproteobacteria bacterium]